MANILQTINKAIVFPYKSHKLCTKIAPHFFSCRSLLDIGTRDGGLISKIATNLGIQACAVDIEDRVCPPNVSFQKIQCDGRLPFENESFDGVLISDVLHHIMDDEVVMNLVMEAMRVGKVVVIKDHVLFTDRFYTMEHWVHKMCDWFGNASFGISVPGKYKKLEEWKRLMEEMNVDVKSLEIFKYSCLDPLRHIIVVL